MRRISTLTFGFLCPMIEVLLVAAGLVLLGWEGVMYTLRGIWPRLTLASLAHGLNVDTSHVSSPAQWLLACSLPGTCIVLALAMFFILPPAYSHSE